MCHSSSVFIGQKIDPLNVVGFYKLHAELVMPAGFSCFCDQNIRSVTMSETFNHEQTKLAWYQRIVEYVEGRGGVVLSERYDHMHAKMNFQCEHGHVFKSLVYDIWGDNWCAECAGNNIRMVDMLKFLQMSVVVA